MNAIEAVISTAASRSKVFAAPWHRHAALTEETLAMGTLDDIAAVIRDFRLESISMVNGRSWLGLLDRTKNLLAPEVAVARNVLATAERIALDLRLAGAAQPVPDPHRYVGLFTNLLPTEQCSDVEQDVH